MNLAFFERTMLGMQREIFFDQATLHTAYAEGGIDAVRALLRSGEIADPGGATLQAWELIDRGNRTGNQSMIADGNLGLLRREQNLIISDNYRDMLNYKPPLGATMTYLMTLAGTPSIPGAHSFGEVFPIVVSGGGGIEIPSLASPMLTYDISGEVSIVTPFPDGNVANSSDRWRLIMADTYPAFLDLYQNDPDQLQHLLSQFADGAVGGLPHREHVR